MSGDLSLGSCLRGSERGGERFAARGLHSSLNWERPATIVSTFHLLLTSSTRSSGTSLSMPWTSLIAPMAEIARSSVSRRRLVSARPELRLTTRPTCSAASVFRLLQRRPISLGAKPGAAAVELPRGDTTRAETIFSSRSSRPRAPATMRSSCFDIQSPSTNCLLETRVRRMADRSPEFTRVARLTREDIPPWQSLPTGGGAKEASCEVRGGCLVVLRRHARAILPAVTSGCASARSRATCWRPRCRRDVIVASRVPSAHAASR